MKLLAIAYFVIFKDIFFASLFYSCVSLDDCEKIDGIFQLFTPNTFCFSSGFCNRSYYSIINVCFSFSFSLQRYNSKLTLLALPSVIYEPRFRGSIRNLVYSDQPNVPPRRQEMRQPRDIKVGMNGPRFHVESSVLRYRSIYESELNFKFWAAV